MKSNFDWNEAMQLSGVPVSQFKEYGTSDKPIPTPPAGTYYYDSIMFALLGADGQYHSFEIDPAVTLQQAAEVIRKAAESIK